MPNWYTITAHTHNEIQWPTTAHHWHFVLQDDASCRQICHLSTPEGGIFFRKCNSFFRYPNLKKRYSKKLSWAWNPNFKLRIASWNISPPGSHSLTILSSSMQLLHRRETYGYLRLHEGFDIIASRTNRWFIFKSRPRWKCIRVTYDMLFPRLNILQNVYVFCCGVML